MRVRFNTNVGRRFELEVSKDDTLHEIKLKIFRNHGVPISSQTLSHDGVIIANNTDLINAHLADGSVIHLDVADAAPIGPPTRAVSEEASSSERPRKRGRLNNRSIRLRLPPPRAAINYPARDGDTVLQLRMWVEDTEDVPIAQIVIRDQTGNELHDSMRLLYSQMPDNPELAVEFLPPEMLNMPPPQFRVILKHGSARMPMILPYGVKAAVLRVNLENLDVSQVFPDLPNPYFFSRNQVPIDENRTFLSQNIASGAIVEILSGRVEGMMNLKLATNIPHKAFFYVQTHSDDTILQLKEKIGINEEIPVDRILIKKNGIELPDDNMLHACSITSDLGITVEILQ